MALIRDRQNAERGKHGMFREDDDGLVIDEKGHPVAVPIDSFVTGLGLSTERALIILRLYQKEWQSADELIPPHRVHQFVLDARRAEELGQALLSYAAQVEKEGANLHRH